MANIISKLAAAYKLYTIGRKIDKQTRYITDPVQRLEAIVRAVILAQGDIPQSLKGTKLENTIIQICQEILDLPLEDIRACVNKHLTKTL